MNIQTRHASPTRDTLPYRDGVGVVLFNTRGEIWMGARRPRWLAADRQLIWQMPQGGLQGRELPLEAAIRELFEETGTGNAMPVAELDRWLSFDLPEHLLGLALKGQYRGQRQLWFAFRHTGTDVEFDLSRHDPMQPEFEAWNWVEPAQAIERVVPWKRALYQTVLEAFAAYVGAPPAPARKTQAPLRSAAPHCVAVP